MTKNFFFISLVFLASSAFATQTQAPTIYWNAQNLHADKECLLQIVRQKMKSDQQNPSPALKLASETPLSEFQDAMEKWWKFRPDVFVNVYDAPQNTIYLTNNMQWYAAPRTPVDSLVHELTHYVQYTDLKTADGDPDELEAEAVKVQTWFRETHGHQIQNQKYQGECL